MSESNEQQVYVKVKDVAGNEFVCPIEALKDLKEVSEKSGPTFGRRGSFASP